MPSGVYVITNTLDGKRYVGVSRDIESRWVGHKSDLRCGKHHSVLLQQAWTELGEDAFTFEVLEHCATTEFSSKEPAYIRKFRANEPEFGYNTMYGEEMKYNPFTIEARKGGIADTEDEGLLAELERRLDFTILALAMRFNVSAEELQRLKELAAEIPL